MAIQISISRPGQTLYPAALVIAQETRIKFFPVAADTKIEVGWAVYADRQSRDEGDLPQYSFGTQFVVADINLTSAISTLRLQLETALRDLCADEAADPNLNSGHRILAKLRDAIISAGAPVAN